MSEKKYGVKLIYHCGDRITKWYPDENQRDEAVAMYKSSKFIKSAKPYPKKK